jgi:hypothetical protein
MALPDGLLDAVRNYLDITWTDAEGDIKLTGIIARGMKYLDAVAGEELNYSAEDKPRELLLTTAGMCAQIPSMNFRLTTWGAACTPESEGGTALCRRELRPLTMVL